MFDKLREIESRYEELTARSGAPHVVSDHVEYTKTVRAMKEIAPVVEKYREHLRVDEQLRGAAEMVASLPAADELHAMAEQELAELRARRDEIEQELRVLLLSSDPNDRKNVVLEFLAGTGGDKAALFAEER